MNREIVFIADFFVEHVLGGGELNNQELVALLEQEKKQIKQIQSHLINKNFLLQNKSSYFIVSNFVNLSFEAREWMTYNCDYLIYEHDHKYLNSRNPAKFKDYKSTISDIRNYFFYKNAQKIFCQTDFHKEIILKNIDLDNVISVGGNLWSIKTLQKLKEFNKKEKIDKISILDSNISHKNTSKAIKFCVEKSLKFELIKDDNYITFLDKLSNNKKFMFFPRSPETLSRVVCEARMMGMSVMVNQLVGASHEDWFNLKGEQLIEFFIKKRQEILQKVLHEVNCIRTPIKRKKVSIITTFHKADEFLKGYLENITNQTMFKDCELVLVDSASPGSEKETVRSYMEKFDNIKYYRFDKNFKPTIGHNIAIKKSTSPFVVWAMIDDRKSLDGIEKLYNKLSSNNNLELVYGDCLTTDKKNETVETTKSTKLSEHSINTFSKENMIKCLPGPMPMWRKRLHEKVGFFDEVNHDFSDDWDLWLRAVNNGCVFEKVEEVVGLYMEGGRSQWQNNLDQRKEEARVFFKNARVFGENYYKFEQYFKQFLEL